MKANISSSLALCLFFWGKAFYFLRKEKDGGKLKSMSEPMSLRQAERKAVKTVSPMVDGEREEMKKKEDAVYLPSARTVAGRRLLSVPSLRLLS